MLRQWKLGKIAWDWNEVEFNRKMGRFGVKLSWTIDDWMTFMDGYRSHRSHTFRIVTWRMIFPKRSLMYSPRMSSEIIPATSEPLAPWASTSLLLLSPFFSYSGCMRPDDLFTLHPSAINFLSRCTHILFLQRKKGDGQKNCKSCNKLRVQRFAATVTAIGVRVAWLLLQNLMLLMVRGNDSHNKE